LAASVPPDKLSPLEPGVAVGVPPQVLVRPFGVAITSPAGKLSVNANPFNDMVLFGLVMLIVSDVVSFNGILVVPNCLVTVCGATQFRVRVCLVWAVPPLVELTVRVVFVTPPACVPVTFTTTTQVVPGVAMLPPVRLMLVVFVAAVTVPPQELVTPGVDA